MQLRIYNNDIDNNYFRYPAFMKKSYVESKYSLIIERYGGVVKMSHRDTPYIRIRCKDTNLGKIFRAIAYNYGAFRTHVINNDCYEIILYNSVSVEKGWLY